MTPCVCYSNVAGDYFIPHGIASTFWFLVSHPHLPGTTPLVCHFSYSIGLLVFKELCHNHGSDVCLLWVTSGLEHKGKKARPLCILELWIFVGFYGPFLEKTLPMYEHAFLGKVQAVRVLPDTRARAGCFIALGGEGTSAVH